MILAATTAGAATPSTPERVGIPLSVAREVIDLGYVEFHRRNTRRLMFTPAYAAAHPDEVARLEDVVVSTVPDVTEYLRHVAARQAHSSMDRLADVELPVLLLAGREDVDGFGMRRVDMAHVMEKALPDADLRLLDGGHGFLWERPDDCAALILRFLAEHTTAEVAAGAPRRHASGQI